MVTARSPDVNEDRETFRTLARHHGGRFGAWTAVVVGGTLRVGDEVCIDPPWVQLPAGEPVVS